MSLARGMSAKGEKARGRKRGSLLKRGETVEDVLDDATVTPQTPGTPAPVAQATLVATLSTNVAPVRRPGGDIDDDPFLKSHVPPLPTQAEIDALLAAPPLSYNAARAAPTTSTAPPRQFCEICGYWGRARCMKCGVRVCGLECKTQHDETRCAKFYA